MGWWDDGMIKVGWWDDDIAKMGRWDDGIMGWLNGMMGWFIIRWDDKMGVRGWWDNGMMGWWDDMIFNFLTDDLGMMLQSGHFVIPLNRNYLSSTFKMWSWDNGVMICGNITMRISDPGMIFSVNGVILCMFAYMRSWGVVSWPFIHCFGYITMY